MQRVLLQTLSMLMAALIGATDWGKARDVVVRLLVPTCPAPPSATWPSPPCATPG